MTDYRALCAELVVIEDALSGGSVQLSSQGQALDGYAGLAAFRYIAAKARIALAQPEPTALTGPALEDLRSIELLLEEHGLFVACTLNIRRALEACCHEVQTLYSGGSRLRAARRPKPPSLKEQAFKALGPEPLPVTAPMGDTILNKNIIERHRLLHRALEALPND